MLWRYQPKGKGDFEFNALHKRWVTYCHQQKLFAHFISEVSPSRKEKPPLPFFFLIQNSESSHDFKISSYWYHLNVVTSQNSKRIQNSMLCIKVAWIFCHQQKFNRLFCSFFFSSINIRIIIQELRIIWYKNYQRVVYYKIEKDAGALIAKGSDTESPQNGLSLS